MALAYMKWVYGRSAFVRYVITKFSFFHMLPIYLSNRAPPRALCAWQLCYKQKNLFVRILLIFHLCASQSTWNTNIWPRTWRVMSLILVWRNIIFCTFRRLNSLSTTTHKILICQQEILFFFHTTILIENYFSWSLGHLSIKGFNTICLLNVWEPTVNFRNQCNLQIS